MAYHPTTIDNPWNPFTEWDPWYSYDVMHGYGTLEKWTALAHTSSAFPEEYNDELLDQAIDSMIDLYPWYIRVSESTVIKPVSLETLATIMKEEIEKQENNNKCDLGN